MWRIALAGCKGATRRQPGLETYRLRNRTRRLREPPPCTDAVAGWDAERLRLVCRRRDRSYSRTRPPQHTSWVSCATAGVKASADGCNCSMKMSPLNCSVILSPWEHEQGDSHVEQERAAASTCPGPAPRGAPH